MHPIPGGTHPTTTLTLRPYNRTSYEPRTHRLTDSKDGGVNAVTDGDYFVLVADLDDGM